ncbi:CHAT domain-containing protein [Fulvivirga sp. RKSG066]|uniref:WD40 domain-containing protein n=1 Tax=Fulvivirga aurantia TaxID=2529383 RepID=UPI0012BC4DEB|nr:caspase family protein [Fulvivirga aurantia]MTI21009.1 CHAT domain-containing protein [Fulvivirga aurantia]
MKGPISLFLTLLLFKLCFAQQLQTVVQRGHNASIKAVAFTKDGKYLLTGSRDKTVKLWEIASGRELRTYYGHESTINDIAISPDGKTFLTSSADKTARLWSIETGEQLQIFEGHKELLTAVDYHPRGKQVITAGYDNNAILWDVETAEQLATFKVNPDKGLGYGVDVVFSPDGKKVVFGNDNKSATIYNLSTLELENEYKPSEGWCGGCATFVKYTSDNQILKGSKDHLLEIISTKLASTKTLAKIDDELTAIDYSVGGKVLLANEDTIKVYDTSGRLLFQQRRTHELPITSAAFSPDGHTIAISSDEPYIKLISAQTGEFIKNIEGYLKQADKGGLEYDPNSRWDYYIKRYTDLKNDFAISPDGKYLVKGKIGNMARMWELQTGVLTQEFRGHTKAVLCMDFSKDGKKLLTGSADNTIKVWNVDDGELLATLKGHRELLFTVKFDENDSKILSTSWDGTVRIWNAETYEQIDYLRLENGSAYDAHFYQNDIYTLTAGLDKTLKLWEVDSKTPVRDFIGHTDIIHDIAINPLNDEVASASWDGNIKIWNVATGLQKKRLKHSEQVYSAEYSHKSKYLAVGGSDRLLRLYKTNNWEADKVLSGHTGAITHVKFTPDDNYLISASDNGELIIWDVNTGSQLITYMVLNENDWMAINTEGFFNATQGATQSIAFVKGMKSYSADQFYDQYYQPDLLNRTFIQDVKKLNINERIEKYPPPKVTIVAPHASETVRSAEVNVIATAEDIGGGIEKVKLVHNGKTVLLENAQPTNGKVAINETVTLVPGVNKLVVSAFSSGGIESSGEVVEITMEGKLASTLYLFTVGINEYKNTDLNLNYAAADAQSIAKTLAQKSKKLFERVETISLSDQEATKENIMLKLSALSKVVKPQDVLVFYYAGHGSMVDNKFYFIPTENTRLYSQDKLDKNAIYAGNLQQKLKDIAALKQLLIIDACQSGGSVELLATRGAGEEKALAQLSRSAGIHVLAAAGSEQFAVEFQELGHGLFTYVLLEALSGRADGSPKDGKITIYELKSFIDDQVPEYSKKYKGKMQFPYTFSRGHDFPIVID